MESGLFPFGFAMISISDSNGFEGSANIRSQLSSSLNSDRKTSIKCFLTFIKASINFSLAVSSISLMVCNKEAFASERSFFWV